MSNWTSSGFSHEMNFPGHPLTESQAYFSFGQALCRYQRGGNRWFAVLFLDDCKWVGLSANKVCLLVSWGSKPSDKVLSNHFQDLKQKYQ